MGAVSTALPTRRADAAGEACPLCENAECAAVLRIETTRPFVIRHCGACDFAFAAPRPDAAELKAFYTFSYFDRTAQTGFGYHGYREVAELNAQYMWRQFHRYVRVDHAPGRRLLDVGCATGGFLHAAKQDGWDGVGLELSTEAVQIARKEFGLNVIEGDVDSQELQQGSYDLVTCWHVIEHLVDPFAALCRIRELVTPQGFLFIELPNWNSLGRRIKQARWSQLKPPEHINFFTPASLSKAVRKAGFKVSRCSTHYPSINDEAAIRRATRPWFMLKALGAHIVSALGSGGYLRLLATPL